MVRSLPLPAALACLLLACGADPGGGDGGPDGGRPDGGASDAGFIDLGPGSPPVLANLRLTPSEVQVGDGTGASVAAALVVDYQDPDGDLVAIRVATAQLGRETPLAGVAGIPSGTIRATVSLSTAAVGQTVVQVVAVDSKGHLSNPLMVVFQVDAPPPAIALLSPASAVAGSPGFTLQVAGSDFPPEARLYWNGSPRPTTVHSSTALSAVLGAGDLSDAGLAVVQVAGADAGAVPSGAVSFPIGGVGTLMVNEPVNDLVYDAARGRLYASVPSLAGARGNSILVVDPLTGQVLDAGFAGSEPGRLALSDDGRYLYVALDGAGAVKRLALPGFTEDLSIPLGADPVVGPYQVADLQVAPGAPRTVAVSLALPQGSPRSVGGLVVFDDAVPRLLRAGDGTQPFASVQWSLDAGALYAADAETSAFTYYSLTVDRGGVALAEELPGTFNHFDFRLWLEPTSGRLYSGSGQVLEPASGRILGTFPTAGPMVVAPALGTAWFLSAGAGAGMTLASYHLTRFVPLDLATLPLPPGLALPPPRLIRWGAQGLASGGGGHPLAIYQGPFLATPAPP